VIVADTNLWARAFLRDDPSRPPRARQALAIARGKEGVFVPLVVFAELSWVLRAARWAREVGFANGCTRAMTFDRLFGRSAKVRRPP
jgi:predicted nucleic acid-binding protein